MLKKSVWELANETRGLLSVYDLHTVTASLLLIKKYNQELLDDYIKGNDTKELIESFKMAKKNYGLSLNSLKFEEIVLSNSGSWLVSLVLFIYELPSEETNDLLMSFFDINKETGGYITNDGVNKLVIKVAKLSSESMVLDPTFGVGTTFNQILKENPSQQIVGQEINETIFDIAQISMICLGAKNVKLYLGDVLAEPKYVERKKLLTYDRVITSPPIGLRDSGNQKYDFENDAYQRYALGNPQKSNLDWAFINNGISSLNSNGRGVFVVSNRTLFGGGANNKIRTNAIRSDLIEGVISLPGGLAAPYTSIPLSLLIVNKNKKENKNKIRFVSGESFFDKTSKSSKVILSEEVIQKISDCYFSDDDKDGFSNTISNQQVLENEAYLVPSSYLSANEYKLSNGLKIRLNKEKWDAKTKVKLSSIVEISRGYNTVSKDEQSDGEYSLIKISDLKDGMVSYSDLARTNVKNNTQVENYQVSVGDILLSIKGTTDKLAFVFESSDSTLVTQNLVRIRVKTDKVDPRWLFEYLCSPVGLSQLKQAEVGTTIAQIPIKALEEVLVPVHSTAEQSKMIQEYQNKQAVLSEKLKKIKQELKETKEKLYNDMALTDLYEIITDTKD